jgi:hypothetical protein
VTASPAGVIPGTSFGPREGCCLAGLAYLAHPAARHPRRPSSLLFARGTPQRIAGRRDGLAVCCTAVWLPGRSSSRRSSPRAPPGTGTARRAIRSARWRSGHAARSRPRTLP